MMPTGAARVAGVMGWPVTHSRSPVLQGHWLTRYGIDGAYVPMAVEPVRLESALRGLVALGFRGCNVTVPHKVAAAGFCDRLSDQARRLGAANTVIVGAEGELFGQNTDGYGFRESLRAAVPDWLGTGKTVLVLGAGGAARAIVDSLGEDGAAEVRLANRSNDRAEALAADLNPSMTIVPWDQRETAAAGADLIVNTTTLGMVGKPALEFSFDDAPGHAVVVDIVYTPLETPFLAAARRRNLSAVDGLGMLLHQARPGFAAWFGVDPIVDEDLRRAVLAVP